LNPTPQGNLPSWFRRHVTGGGIKAERREIELKYLLPRAVWSEISPNWKVEGVPISQYYLPAELGMAMVKKLAPLAGASETELPVFDEWRVRGKGSNHYFTAKGAIRGTGGVERHEFEVSISADEFAKTISTSGISGLEKVRCSHPLAFSDTQVVAECDDYTRVGDQQDRRLDFLVCELEVESREIAEIIRAGSFFAPDLQFIRACVEVTGLKEFGNHSIATKGLPVGSIEEAVGWINNRRKKVIQEEIDAFTTTSDSSHLEQASEQMRLIIAPLRLSGAWGRDVPTISLAQDVLGGLRFTEKQSQANYGRKDTSDPHLQELDRLGRGWLRDYHEIVSGTFYIRLHSKPQILRPGAGSANTTTRGAHTSDVIAASCQIARQLGLNVDLCMAMAAMHDIGHPVGGHVGEDVLSELAGQRFEHHIFSLSLVDIYGLNVMSEVQVGAFHHKSGGRNLVAPRGCPQEFGIVRIADKIAYAPWDLFDSLRNGFLLRSEIPERIFSTLGDNPMRWIQTLVEAAVIESARFHRVQFSEASGDIFHAFKEARELVYTKVHPQIEWAGFRQQMHLCHRHLAESLERLAETQNLERAIDPIPVLAFLTDHELNQLTSIIESRPSSRILDFREMSERGMDFPEIVDLLASPALRPEAVFYSPGQSKLPFVE